MLKLESLHERKSLHYRQLTLSTDFSNAQKLIDFMTTEKAQRLILIFRQIREVMKNTIDDIEAIAENALMIFVDGSEQKKVSASVAIESRLFNQKELAAKLGISTRTVSNLQNEGMPKIKLGDRVVFDYEEVLNWAKGRKLKSRRNNNLRVVR